MRSNIKLSEKTSTFRGKGLFFLCIVFLLISIILSSFIGCTRKNEEEELIIIDYSDIYYISKKSTNFPIQFAFKDVIEQIEIFDVKTSNELNLNWEFVEEKDSNGELFKMGNYYVYGIIFDLESEEDFTWQSFSLKINNFFIKTVDLNIKVKLLEFNNDEDDIRPLSIPYISDFTDEAEWVFLPMNNIEITSIDVISCLSIENQVFFNSIEYTGSKVVERLDKFYINIHFTDYKLTGKVDKVYIQINYKKNGQDYKYLSDYSIFGNQLELLYNKMIKR